MISRDASGPRPRFVPPVRVVLCDDHDLFRLGIAEMIGTTRDIEVVGEASTHDEVVSVVSKTRPDVVLFDLEMPGRRSAEESMHRLFQLTGEIPKVIIVTMYDEPRLIRRFMARGASAYLSKSASLDELLSTIREAARSPVSPPEEDGPRIIPEEVLQDLDTQADGLSKREIEVLLQAARGMSNRQISTSLHLSEATIKRHLANIYKKTGTGSRAEVTQTALANGWISPYEVSEEYGRSDRRRHGSSD